MLPTVAKQYAAVIDIGTNSVLLLAGHCTEHGPEEVAEEFATTRLGEGLSESSHLLPSAVDRTLKAVRRYRDILPRLIPQGGVGIACATCAVREAANPEMFVRPCEDLLGGRLLLLSGRQEAALSFQGATWEAPPERPALVIDVGGGSTELAHGAAGTPPDIVYSLPLGCVRLTERFGLHDRAAEGAVRHAWADIVRSIEQSHPEWRPRSGTICIAVGGTATTYAAVRQGLVPYDRTRVHGFEDRTGNVLAEAERLARMSAAERRTVPGLPPDRAEILPAGLLILGEILRLLRIPQFRVSARGLRFGVLLDLCAGRLGPGFRWGASGI